MTIKAREVVLGPEVDENQTKTNEGGSRGYASSVFSIRKYDNKAVSQLQKALGIKSHLTVKALWRCGPSDLNILFVDVLSNHPVWVLFRWQEVTLSV